MKKSPLILICLFTFVARQSIFSQNEPMRPKPYEIAGIVQLSLKGFQKRIVLEEKGSVIFDGKWGASLSHNYFTLKARRLPGDFRCNYLDTDPQDQLETYSLRVLRNFGNASQKHNVGVECGLTWLYCKSAQFTPVRNNKGNETKGYYNIRYRARNNLGLSLRLKSEIMLTKMASIELATVANFDRQNYYVGCELFLSGKLVKAKTRALKNKTKHH
jgi:hypothetical protein